MPSTAVEIEPTQRPKTERIIMCDSFKKHYQLCDEIGRGRFGVVYRCFSPSSSSLSSFAVKSIDKRLLLDDPTDRECLDKEPKFLQILSPHPHILQIHSLFESESHLLIVTDLCQESTLYDRILAAKTFSEPDAAALFSQLADAIGHCHRNFVAHRDIKPENILFDSRNRLKLCDFGSAEWFGGENEWMKGVVGTPYYVAPEVLAGREYNEKVDVWSAGVILYIMLGGVPPFCGETVEETFHAVLRANLRFPARIFRSVSPQAKDLIRKMLCKDVSRRFSADQVLRHPWVTGGGVASAMADIT
ncbi:hypothetical protein Cgig2_000038 [Carnegiea gigantea]|uniref:Protein kinase domain-containing protein n=1 Tax=Carnegiea gigantea TaxID=171969 RepID=A0A9Q1KZB7_9CARY|nr:hypothetical protein Cgig2_000038 [Carnegiea gigantea]